MAKLGPSLGVSAVLIIVILAGFTLFSKNQPPTASPGSAPTFSAPPPATPSLAKQDSPALSYQTQAAKQAALDDGDLRPMTTPQVVKLSTRIILARCLGVNVKEVTGGNIFTFSEFETLEVLKGKHVGKNITLRLYGGRIGNVEIENSLMPRFAAGEEVVLALGGDNMDGYPTIFPQGTFRIALDPTSNRRVVVTKPIGLPILRAKDRQPYSTSPEPLPLDDFLFTLRQLISGN